MELNLRVEMNFFFDKRKMSHRPGGKYSFIANPLEDYLHVDFLPLLIFGTIISAGSGIALGFFLSSRNQ